MFEGILWSQHTREDKIRPLAPESTTKWETLRDGFLLTGFCFIRKRTTFSSDGSLKAVFAKFKPNKKKPDEESEAIEIYNSVGKIATNDLGATKRHGKFYTDSQSCYLPSATSSQPVCVCRRDGKL